MTIKFVTSRATKVSGIYIGPTGDPDRAPFSNPFAPDAADKMYKVADHEEALALYEVWIRERWDQHEWTRLCLSELVRREMRGEDITLVDNCYPERSHGELLRELVEQMAFLGVVSDGRIAGSDDLPF